MTALLTDHLPLLAGAPNGIKKLRELILELAVRGKLVPQQSEESSAKIGLDASRAERAKAMGEGKIKREKPALEVEDSEQPFTLPDGWAWCRIVDTGDYINGLAFKPSDWSSIGRPIIRIQNLSGRNSQFNRTGREVDASVVVNPGDILVSWSATLDAFIWQGEQGVLNQHIFRVTPSGVMHSQYLYWLLKWAIKVLADSDHAHGLVMAHINRGPFLAQPVGLPPLAEQRRIVAKIDELMVLCDRLEAQQAAAESAHAQLVQSLLGSLTQAADSEDFAASWQRLAEHFHTLFITESSIDALKQTLLQLAVMGKLVPQDPSDEPANEMLKRVEFEKQTVFVGRHKVDKLRSTDADDEKPFTIPSQWTWARLGELAISGPSNGYSPKPASVETPYRCLTLSATTRGAFNDQCFKFVDIDAATAGKYFLKSGDLLIQRANSIDYVGVSAIYDGADDHFIFPDLIMRLKISDGLNGYFIHSYLSSATGRAYFRAHATGTQGNMPKINQGTVVNAPVPIPPLAEQHRIVAKVDQLITLCDQLKTRLTQARQFNDQLATALVEQAVADDSRQSPTTSDRKTARTLLAAEITHQLYSHRTFGQRKLQKAIYLAEHTAKLAAIQGNYLRNVAGPHDRQLMDQAETGMHMQHWYERIERDTVGHAYRPLAKAGQHRQAYENTWSAAERATIEQVIALMRDWDTDRCEMTVTLYAAWNDFILEGRPVTDDAIVGEVMHRWNDAKLRFTRAEWLAVLAEMKKHRLLTPNGFGKRTVGGTLALPGFE